MKRTDVVRHLRKNGCNLHREGGRHSIFLHSINGESTSVPRHLEIDDDLVKKICKDLHIDSPWK